MELRVYNSRGIILYTSRDMYTQTSLSGYSLEWGTCES